MLVAAFRFPVIKLWGVKISKDKSQPNYDQTIEALAELGPGKLPCALTNLKSVQQSLQQSLQQSQAETSQKLFLHTAGLFMH